MMTDRAIIIDGLHLSIKITELIKASDVAKMEALLYDGHHKFNVLDDKGQPALSGWSRDTNEQDGT